MPIYRCIVCGKMEYRGCDDISGNIVRIIQYICNECAKKSKEEIKKLLRSGGFR